MAYPDLVNPAFDSNQWVHWSRVEPSSPHPSQYLSSRSTQRSESRAVYEQYGHQSPFTGPPVQAPSSYVSARHLLPTRSKSMSWPPGLFTSNGHSQHDEGQMLPAYKQHEFNQQGIVGFVHHGLPFYSPRPESLPLVPQEPHSMLSAATYSICPLPTPDSSVDDYSSTISTASPSSQSLLGRSTPIPVTVPPNAVPAEKGLLGLNCHFDGGQPTASGPSSKKPKRATLTRSKTSPSAVHNSDTLFDYDKRMHDCNFCDMRFDRKSNLTDHTRKHGVGKRHVPCHFDGCTKVYGRQADVNRHVRSFHVKEMSECQHCGKTFVRSDSLTRHNVDNCRKRQEKYRRQRQLPGPQINLPTPTFSAPGSEDEVGSLVKRKPDGAWHEERGHYEGQFAHTQ